MASQKLPFWCFVFIVADKQVKRFIAAKVVFVLTIQIIGSNIGENVILATDLIADPMIGTSLIMIMSIIFKDMQIFKILLKEKNSENLSMLWASHTLCSIKP